MFLQTNYFNFVLLLWTYVSGPLLCMAIYSSILLQVNSIYHDSTFMTLKYNIYYLLFER